MIHYKKLAILSLAGLLLGTLPNISASAAELTVTNTETIVAEDADNKNPAVPAPEDQKENQEEVKKENKTDKEASKKEKEEPTVSKINYKSQILTITKDGFVADSFQGVDALYRKGRSDGSSTTYSCAAYIKRFYKEIYGVSVNNLFAGRTPASSKGTFKSVKTPEAGDIVACPSSSGSNHWAIVKQVNDDNTVTLIEQNWKWSQGGQTVCKINRSISISSGKFYRLYK